MSSKRIKHVVQNPYHLWAHESQDWARTSGGNESFEGRHAKSYAATIASIVRNKKGKRAFLIAAQYWSPTTSRHQGSMRYAIPPDELKFYVPHTDPQHAADHFENVKYMWGKIGEFLLAAKRARTCKDSYTLQAFEVSKSLTEYLAFFGLKGKAYKAPSATLEADALAQAETFAKEETRIRKAEEKRQAEQDARNRAEAAEKLQKWQAGEPVYLPYLRAAFLRVSPADPATVETTQGATVPLEHVRRVLPVVLRKVQAGQAWKPNGETIRLGTYAVSGIDAQGNLTVGCHTFERAEVERFAAVIGE